MVTISNNNNILTDDNDVINLMNIINQKNDPIIIGDSILTLSIIEPNRAKDIVINHLKSNSRYIRLASVRSLQNLKLPYAIKIKILTDIVSNRHEYSNIRENAINILSNLNYDLNDLIISIICNNDEDIKLKLNVINKLDITKLSGNDIDKLSKHIIYANNNIALSMKYIKLLLKCPVDKAIPLIYIFINNNRGTLSKVEIKHIENMIVKNFNINHSILKLAHI